MQHYLSMSDFDSRQGHFYANNAIRHWVNTRHAPHDGAFKKAFEADKEDGLPAIQIDPCEGQLLKLLLTMIHATHVVEVGTLAGYSTIAIAMALPPQGQLFSIEADPHHAEIAKRNIHDANLACDVHILCGTGLQTLPTLESKGPFDAMFIDADKIGYVDYGAWGAKHIKQGGLLIADNVYLFGKLLDDSPEATTMRQFHEDTTNAFDTTCIPTPDGLLLGIKR